MPIGLLRRMLRYAAKLVPHLGLAIFAIAVHAVVMSDQAPGLGHAEAYAAQATLNVVDTGSEPIIAVSNGQRLPERPPYGACRPVFSRLSTRAHSARSVTTALESVEPRPSLARVRAGFASNYGRERAAAGPSRSLAQPGAPPVAA